MLNKNFILGCFMKPVIKEIVTAVLIGAGMVFLAAVLFLIIFFLSIYVHST